ncbi:MAG: hypothetical protein ACOYMD_07155 [Paludibacter sp.]
MEENNTKEVNLLQLIGMFFNWLKNIGIKLFQFLGFLIRLSYRHKVTVIIVMVLSIVAGQYLARPAARIYKAGAMVVLYGSQAETVKEICRQLENTSPLNKLISLGTKLSLPDSIAKNVVEIRSFYVIDYLKDEVPDKIDFDNSHSLTDTLNVRMRDRFYLQIKTKSIAQVPKVQVAIQNFFNTNAILRLKFDISKAELANQIQICNIELKRIDSLAQVSYFKEKDNQLQFEKNKLLLGEQTKQLFYNELLHLQDIKTYSQSKMGDYVQPVQMPSGFVVNPVPLNGRVKYGIFSLLIGFAIAVIIAGIKENMKKISGYLKA